MKIERLIEEPGELTEESLEKLLEIKVSAGTKWELIKNNIEAGLFLRFTVTNDYDIYIAPGSHTHEGLLEDNDLDWKDCWLTNGVLKEEDSGDIVFIYHSTARVSHHRVVEKKIIDYLDKKSGVRLSSRKIKSIYSTDK